MDVTEVSERLAIAMARQLRVRSGSLADVTARAGRRLPRHLRAEAEAVIEAEALAAHPNLAYRVNPKALRKSERKLMNFLDKQNPRAERRAEVLDRIAGVVFILFTVVLAVFLLLLWRGYFG